MTEQEATGETGHPRPRKAPGAFRTISEVADELHIPQHVLRFWETRFPQIRPLKRGGGRRYYRPDDIALLRRISGLLYIQGYTIKGVQRLLREGGGTLAVDIPPAPPVRRAVASAERLATEPELPMPGLEPASPARPATARVTLRPKIEKMEKAETEVARLRAVLKAVLAELEALRALVG